MKATELMIGDWVLAQFINGDRYARISCIAIDCAVVSVGDREYEHDYDAVLPIPLTDDILKANGCELVEVGDNGPGTPKKNINRFEKWQLSTKWNDIFIFFDRLLKNYSINAQYGVIRDLKNVHEMQHALRICGLHEVADHFKLE